MGKLKDYVEQINNENLLYKCDEPFVYEDQYQYRLANPTASRGGEDTQFCHTLEVTVTRGKVILFKDIRQHYNFSRKSIELEMIDLLDEYIIKKMLHVAFVSAHLKHEVVEGLRAIERLEQELKEGSREKLSLIQAWEREKKGRV